MTEEFKIPALPVGHSIKPVEHGQPVPVERQRQAHDGNSGRQAYSGLRSKAAMQTSYSLEDITPQQAGLLLTTDLMQQAENLNLPGAMALKAALEHVRDNAISSNDKIILARAGRLEFSAEAHASNTGVTSYDDGRIAAMLDTFHQYARPMGKECAIERA